MSSFTKIDYCSTNFNSGSTRNAPKISSESHICKTDSDEVYAIPKDDGSNNKVEQTKKVVPQNLTPVMILVVDTISSVSSWTLLRVLFNSGSMTTLTNKRCISRHCKAQEIASSRKVNTLAGTYTSTEVVIMITLRISEFDKNRYVNQQKALVFQSETCRYNVILGAIFLTKTGIDVKYSTGTMEWFDNELPLRNPRLLQNKDFEAMAEMIKVQQEEELFGMDWYDPTGYATEILDAKYETVEVDEVINQPNHLNLEQKEDLRKVLMEHTKLFDETLGVYPHRKFHIDLVPWAIAKHARPYLVPVIQLSAFKKELLHLVEIGVLPLQGAREWASPTFITPKKDGRVHWVSDLRELNNVVKRKQHPLPIIGYFMTT